jgi:hypothetical protein
MAANREQHVKIDYSPTFDESKHGEHGYEKDELSTEELRAFGAPALKDFKGESLQQARLTVDSENSPLYEKPPFDTTPFEEQRALEALEDQQNRKENFVGITNAPSQVARIGGPRG